MKPFQNFITEKVNFSVDNLTLYKNSLIIPLEYNGVVKSWLFKNMSEDKFISMAMYDIITSIDNGHNIKDGIDFTINNSSYSLSVENGVITFTSDKSLNLDNLLLTFSK